MNKSTLDQANSIISAMKALDNLNIVMNVPYPQFLCSNMEVNSACFDKITLNNLKMTIKDFIEKRKIELQKEFESL